MARDWPVWPVEATSEVTGSRGFEHWLTVLDNILWIIQLLPHYFRRKSKFLLLILKLNVPHFINKLVLELVLLNSSIIQSMPWIASLGVFPLTFRGSHGSKITTSEVISELEVNWFWDFLLVDWLVLVVVLRVNEAVVRPMVDYAGTWARVDVIMKVESLLVWIYLSHRFQVLGFWGLNCCKLA
jgi:hypothetical protein